MHDKSYGAKASSAGVLMPIDENAVKSYLRGQLTVMKISVAEVDTYITQILLMGGALFWRSGWLFAERVDTFDTVVGTGEYKLDAVLDDSPVDAVYGVRRLSTSDDGFDLDCETDHAFRAIYPNPAARAQGKPFVYTVITRANGKYLSIMNVPDTVYEMEVTYRLEWTEDRVSEIPDSFYDLFIEACRVYLLPTGGTQFQTYEYMRNDAKKSDRVSRRRMVTRRNPGRSPGLSDRDRALSRDYYD